ncbi:PD-(D/E)XK nuclease family protein [Lactobacillus porci]|uniref:PD-(D/E)XK nuclease family protein n=1 Tax=Lactobacillus porci TaxID=2012477 RepID=UPI003991180B
MIKILTGRQYDPLQDELLSRAAKCYLADRQKETFVIVPNHIKFNTEVATIEKVAQIQGQDETSVKNLHVLSFSRLAWYLFKKADISLPESLDDAAAVMILEKIVTQEQEKLRLFQNTHANQGMIKQLYNTILQIHTGRLDLAGLLDDAANPAVAGDLDTETADKLHDLNIIYDRFLATILQKHFATKDELNIELNDVLQNNPQLLAGSSFFFTDFSHFSIQEKTTVQLLAVYAENLTLAFKTADGKIAGGVLPGDYDYVVQKTIRDLLGYFREHQLPFQTEAGNFLGHKGAGSPGQADLNQLWLQGSQARASLQNLSLVKADSRYAEAYFVARTIYQQVVTGGASYNDFLVLAPNLQEYETYLLPILRQNRIPFFDDLQQQMKYHPLAIFLEDLAKLYAEPGQTGAILGIMKTRLLIPRGYFIKAAQKHGLDWYAPESQKDRAVCQEAERAYLRDVDRLETFVLSHGITHSLWNKSFKDFAKAQITYLDLDDKLIKRLDSLREYFVSRLAKLAGQLKQETDSQTAVTDFFTFLTGEGVSDQLDRWRGIANDAGDLQQAQWPEQVWNLLLQLLKDYLLINPEQFDAQSFFKMLQAAFSEAEFATIPSTLDAVTLSELGMVQKARYKQVFIIGASSGSLPKIENKPAFLTSENLAQLDQFFDEDSYLEDRQDLNNLDQEYQFGGALALASERVYVSYPVINSNNDPLEPSPYYERLLNLAGGREYAQHDLPKIEAGGEELAKQLLLFMTTPQASVGYLTYANLLAKGQSRFLTKLLELTERYIPDRLAAIKQGMAFDNNPENISMELAERLYGKNMSSSVSQLESYYKNSYEYFLNYGLRLRRRAENELDVIQAGNYFHRTFELLVKELKAQGKNIAEMDNLELEQFLAEIRRKIAQEPIYQQLLNDPFNQYLFHAFDKTTSKVARAYRDEQQMTRMHAVFAELPFGPTEKIAGLELPLKKFAGKRKVNIRGKIDRVDLFQGEKHVLGQLIDYKSSEHKFKLAPFANGIDLQMITYLDVLQKNAHLLAAEKQLDLLGAFYQYVTRKLNSINATGSNAVLDAKLLPKADKLGGENWLALKGVYVGNPDWFAEVDDVIKKGLDQEAAGYKSRIYSRVVTKKGGGLRQTPTEFTEDELQLLLEYAEYLIEQAADEIFSGQIKLNPYRMGAENGLRYSDFKDIFFFDEQLPENHYHEIQSMNKDELLAAARQALGKEETEDAE